MTVYEAERDAAALLKASWSAVGDSVPVDPFVIAQGLGIKVQEIYLPADESGSIEMPPNGEVVITVNASDHENRQRFTCAHEIGHYIRRNQKNPGQLRYKDYRSTLAGLGSNEDEIYANQFAAALLMPARAVQRVSREGWEPAAMARQFGTSEQAMEIRLRNLRLK